MWHRYDNDLKRTVLHAVQSEAGAEPGLTTARGVTTAQLLQGLMAESRVASLALARLDALPDLSRDLLGRKDGFEPMGGFEQAVGSADLVVTPEAHAALERAYQIAAELGDGAIGGEHLLLALTREPETSDAGQALARRGVSWKRVGQVLMQIQGHRLCPPEGVCVRGLRVRKWKRNLRAQAARMKRLYGLSQARVPFMTYARAPERTLDDPYPFYAKLRRHSTYWDSLAGQWVVTGYQDVVEALAEPRLSQRIFAASAWSETEISPRVQQEFRRLQRSLDRQMLFLDAPHQPRQRARVARRFTPRVIAQMRDDMQAVTDELLDATGPKGGMEVIADLAVPYPLMVILRMLGLPVDDLSRFKRWSADYFTYLTFDTTLAQDLAAYRSVQEAEAYFRSLIPERRRHPQADILSLLLEADGEGEYLPEEEVLANCLLLLATGHENTTRLIGSGLLALLQRPNQWQVLRNDPSVIGPAVEELLRFESPVQWALRYVPEDFRWRGHLLKRGQRVQIGLAAANRDPAQFCDPDRLDVTRTENRHVAFGHGPHFCLGAALTRMETQIVLASLIARFPRLRLAQPPVHLHVGLAFRGLESLHVRWD